MICRILSFLNAFRLFHSLLLENKKKRKKVLWARRWKIEKKGKSRIEEE